MSDELLTLFDGKVIGSVIRGRNGELAFRYLQAWLEAEEAYPLSLSMPLSSEEHILFVLVRSTTLFLY